jgi:hypothetical protein
MMLSSYPFWWLALPVLLLPIWWHRQKRQRLKAEPLATARFLPSAAPEQLRIWRWRDRILLLVRCLLLVTLIAWLAATIFPWRGDTVLLDAGADKAWSEQQIAAAGMTAASRIALPADALHWLRQHERDWRANAKLLIVARAGQIAMPARIPQFSHQVELRTAPATAQAAATPAEHSVTLAAPTERATAWQSLFAAFTRAGDAARRYTLATAPVPGTELIVWDTPNAAPPADWRAAHWWIAPAPAAAAPSVATAFPDADGQRHRAEIRRQPAWPPVDLRRLPAARRRQRPRALRHLAAAASRPRASLSGPVANLRRRPQRPAAHHRREARHLAHARPAGALHPGTDPDSCPAKLTTCAAAYRAR